MTARPDVLALFLRSEPLGEVRQLRNGRLRLQFSDEALQRWGEGSRPLSLSLPLTPRRVDGVSVHRFLDNLLPEGPVRAALEREHDVRPSDTFALLAHVGVECAGAVQLVPEGIGLGRGHLRPLDDDEFAALVTELPTLDPPDGLAVTASLGGVQAKVLLHRSESGWSWPADGALSTHIIKPEPLGGTGIERLVRLEHWTLCLARASGIPAARSELVEIDGREAIVVERYDRTGGRRTHQEDLAQALGLAAQDKYEPSGQSPGRLAAVARAASAEAVDPTLLRKDLLRLVAFNTIIGNGDAHAKNYSLLIDAEASYSVAPLYDAAPVYLASSTYRHSGLAVAGRNRLDLITGAHLVDEATTWGMRRSEVVGTIVETAQAVRRGLDDIDVALPQDDVHALVAERAAAVERSADSLSPRR
ncbi:HipA domain-containing protein [Cellulosimicrobium composti]|uniref:Type II toxin-antitoxin system HipA family toxin n=1 Tax=Cellulosimicrobium composti TaxID=2672572 RepID=A0ABX0BCB3_9MICO|nr:HipA domain-containing protein [Cellulosimicrobium composti]NDO89563.1 type II toxin-antitoxin system HipA family toxin [Cellulosimicrobium composti]